MTFPRFSLLALTIVALLSFVGSSRAQGSSGIALGAYYYLGNGMCAPGDSAAVDAWRSQVGRLPAVWSIYQSWTGWNQFPVSNARRASQIGGRLMVTWEPWGNGARDSSWSCRAVASGAYDPYIRQYARAVKSSGAPVLIRLAHEMNGDWYPWGTAYVSSNARNNGNSPADYVNMWRRVVRIFRVEGARNASWVWAPNIVYQTPVNSIERQRADLSDLYPGDDWVDWVGLSVYNDGARRPWRSFEQLFDGSYRMITAISDKPMMIAELGVTEQGAPRGESKAQWISDTFLQEIPTRYPRVRLVNYFFRDKTDMGESNFRFDSTPAALSAFRQVVASPLYGGNIGGALQRPSIPRTSYVAKASVRPQVHFQPQARFDPQYQTPSTAMSGNDGYLRNGNATVRLPRLSMSR